MLSIQNEAKSQLNKIVYEITAKLQEHKNYLENDRFDCLNQNAFHLYSCGNSPKSGNFVEFQAYN